MTRKRHIFIVEDNLDICKAVRFQLEQKDYQVTTFQDGKLGLQAALDRLPDLIILDLMLPGLSGEEVCKGIREHENEKIQKIPIIMLTAKNADSDAIVGRVIGASYYMTKPFSVDDLQKQMERLLASGAPPRAGSS